MYTNDHYGLFDKARIKAKLRKIRKLLDKVNELADEAAAARTGSGRDRKLRKARKKAQDILDAYAKVQAIDAAKFEDIYEEWVAEDKIGDFENQLDAITAFANDEIDDPDDFEGGDAGIPAVAAAAAGATAAMQDARGTGAYMPGRGGRRGGAQGGRHQRGTMTVAQAQQFLANPANQSKPMAWKHAMKIAGQGSDGRFQDKRKSGNKSPYHDTRGFDARRTSGKMMGAGRGSAGRGSGDAGGRAKHHMKSQRVSGYGSQPWIQSTLPGSGEVKTMQSEIMYGRMHRGTHRQLGPHSGQGASYGAFAMSDLFDADLMDDEEGYGGLDAVDNLDLHDVLDINWGRQ